MSGILPYIQKEALSCAHRRHRPRHFELGRSYLARLPGACVIASFPGEPFGFLLQKIKRDADTKL